MPTQSKSHPLRYNDLSERDRYKYSIQRLPELQDAWDYFYLPEIKHAAQFSDVNQVDFQIIAHGAGTQTNILHMLAANAHHFVGTPYHLPCAFSLHADVGDDGTPCEYDETTIYLMKAQELNPYLPLYRVMPGFWGSLSGRDTTGGLYDRYLARRTIPVRVFRSCTGDYKVKPQLDMLQYIHDETLLRTGVYITFTQIIGYAVGEEKRAERFNASKPYIKGRFPLIEWGWDKKTTVAMFRELLPVEHHLLGNPPSSGCWFCPFQKRGRIDPHTLTPTPHSWLDLYLNYPDLWRKAVEMETVNNGRRTQQGKKPIYLYGTKPLTEWVDEKYLTIQMALPFDLAEGDGKGDDICEGWACRL